MALKRICIDISNLFPGKGGSGGGIATYAINLIRQLDTICVSGEWEIICLKHKDFNGFEQLRNIRFVNVGFRLDNPLVRLFWMQVYLPYYCLQKRISLLHRVTPEMPSVKVCKYVCTLHDLMFDLYLSDESLKKTLSKRTLLKFHLFKRITKNALKNSDCVIVPSNTIKTETLQKYRVNDEKIKVIYEASESIELTRNIVAVKKGEAIVKIAVIAGFYPHKGHLKVLELAKKLLESGFLNFHIYLRGNPAGFDNYIEVVKAAIEEYSLAEYISFVPFTAKATLEDIYSQYDAILLLSQYEGFGLPVLEAQSYEIPLLCSNIPIFREILGDSAIFVDKKLGDASIRRIKELLTDTEALNDFVAKGIKNVKRYSWEKMSAQTLELYEQTILTA